MSAGRASGDLLDRLSIGLVLTAHPTEARRRTLLVALRRCYRLLDRLDDPRLTPAEDAEIRRRLREEITHPVAHAADPRSTAPAPLDEVRTRDGRSSTSRCSWSRRACTGLDARSTGRVGGPRSGAAGPAAPRRAAFLRWGSWIGGDRDGNPNVTADRRAKPCASRPTTCCAPTRRSAAG